MKFIAITTAAILSLCQFALAGVSPVPVSLRSTISQDIGKTTVTIDYSRPNVKGRQIFGDLVPLDEVWRTGANKCTSIEFNTTVLIDGNEVPAGKYALFTIPGENEWKVILNSDSEQFGAFQQDVSKDILQFSTPSESLPSSKETLEIAFTNSVGNTSNIEICWADRKVSFPIGVTDESNHQRMLEDIDRFVIKGEELNWQNYGEAARYYYRNEIDLNLALGWYARANELHPDAFWLFYERANLLDKMGKKAEALKVLETGLEIARSKESEMGIKRGEKIRDRIGAS